MASIIYRFCKVYSRIAIGGDGYAAYFVRLAAHVSNGLKSRIRPVVGRI